MRDDGTPTLEDHVTLVPRRARRMLMVIAALLAVAAMAPAAASANGFGYTELKLDPGTATALTSAPPAGFGLTPGLVGAATLSNPGSLLDGIRFPITNTLWNTLFTRQIRHTGGISLTGGGTTVTLTDYTINLGWNPTLTAVVSATGAVNASFGRVPILKLGFMGAGVNLGGGVLRIGPVTGRLTSTAASALTAAFGAPDLTGTVLGKATVYRKL